MKGKYIKIIGVKFDPLNGLEVVADTNKKDYVEAGKYVDKCNDDNTIFIGVPCTYQMGR